MLQTLLSGGQQKNKIIFPVCKAPEIEKVAENIGHNMILSVEVSKI